MQGSPRRQLIPFGLLGLAGLVAVSAILGAGGAGPGELLTNGTFETWTGGAPDGWAGSGVVQVPGAAGFGAKIGPGGSAAQVVSVAPGSTVLGAVTAMSDGPGPSSIRVRLDFLDAGFALLGQALQVWPVNSQPTTFRLERTVPPGSVFLRFALAASSGTAIFDDASLMVTAAAPTETPTPIPDTPTPTPAGVPPTATSPGPASATPTAPAGATETPTPAKPGTPTPNPAPSTPTPPAPTPTPRRGLPPPPEGGFGGLLANGDFEIVFSEQPAYWSKFGGIFDSVTFAHGGNGAASLISDSSATKWIYQVVLVKAGSWYEGSAWAYLTAAAGDAFIRISWYPSADGSGSALDQSDSETTSAASWTYLTTGRLQVPPGIVSARFRLMFRPGDGSTALFDDAQLVEVPAAASTPTPPVRPTATTTPRPSAPAATPTDPAAPGAAPSATRGAELPGTRTPGVPASGGTPGPLGIASSAASGLRISEILSDPDEGGRDADFEWVELVNIGDAPIDLSGWKLGDAKSLDALPAFIVAPHSYVVVAAKGATFPAGVAVTRVSNGQIGSGLNNDGDSVRLFGPDGELVDAVSYGVERSVFDPPPAAPRSGESLGVREPGADPAAENWAITLRPTPGEPNSFAAKQPAATATAGSGTRTPAARGTSTPADLAQLVDRAPVQAANDRSVLPWIVLGAAIATGASFGGPYVFRAARRLRRGS